MSSSCIEDIRAFCEKNTQTGDCKLGDPSGTVCCSEVQECNREDNKPYVRCYNIQDISRNDSDGSSLNAYEMDKEQAANASFELSGGRPEKHEEIGHQGFNDSGDTDDSSKQVNISLMFKIALMAAAFLLAAALVYYMIFWQAGSSDIYSDYDLSHYIKDHIAKEFKIKDIVRHLIRHGVEKKAIIKAIKKLGINDPAIKSWMEDKQYYSQEDSIEKSDISDLVSYIAENKNKGFSEEDIRHHLLSYGYDKNTVDQAFIEL